MHKVTVTLPEMLSYFAMQLIAFFHFEACESTGDEFVLPGPQMQYSSSRALATRLKYEGMSWRGLRTSWKWNVWVLSETFNCCMLKDEFLSVSPFFSNEGLRCLWKCQKKRLLKVENIHKQMYRVKIPNLTLCRNYQRGLNSFHYKLFANNASAASGSAGTQ